MRPVEAPALLCLRALQIDDENAWWEGLDDGVFTIEAVVHDDYATAYYREKVKGVSPEDQNE